MDIKARVTEANIELHTAIAHDYDSRQAVSHPEVRRNLLQFINKHLGSASGRLLDIGCGTGLASSLVKNDKLNITGIDITPAMLETARRRLPNAHFVIADASNPPFLSETFDAAIISGVLHHVVDYTDVLRQTTQLLKPGAPILIINEPNSTGYAMLRPIRFATSRIIPEKRVYRHIVSGNIPADTENLAEYHLHHGNGIDPELVSYSLESQGFTISEIQYTNLGIIANIGERIGINLLSPFSPLRFISFGANSIDFNLAAVKTNDQRSTTPDE